MSVKGAGVRAGENWLEEQSGKIAPWRPVCRCSRIATPYYSSRMGHATYASPREYLRRRVCNHVSQGPALTGDHIFMYLAGSTASTTGTRAKNGGETTDMRAPLHLGCNQPSYRMGHHHLAQHGPVIYILFVAPRPLQNHMYVCYGRVHRRSSSLIFYYKSWHSMCMARGALYL